METNLIPAWVPCELCEDFMCNIHHMHVYDCECPPIDEWAEEDLDPYSPCVDSDNRANPLKGASESSSRV